MGIDFIKMNVRVLNDRGLSVGKMTAEQVAVAIIRVMQGGGTLQ